MPSSPRVARRILSVIGFLAILLMIGGLICVVLVARMPHAGTISEPLVGTWRSVRVDDPHGLGESIWDLRDDGTARWRLSSRQSLGSAGNTTGYFEWWTEEPGMFGIHQYSSKSAALRARLISAILGPQAGRTVFELVEISEHEFTLRSQEGKKVTYRRTNDSTIQQSP